MEPKSRIFNKLTPGSGGLKAIVILFANIHQTMPFTTAKTVCS